MIDILQRWYTERDLIVLYTLKVVYGARFHNVRRCDVQRERMICTMVHSACGTLVRKPSKQSGHEDQPLPLLSESRNYKGVYCQWEKGLHGDW